MGRRGIGRRALVYIGGERSFGYHRSVEDAARAVDYGRWTLGLPPVNFPDSFDETLARRDQWMTRTSRGPRGLAAKVVETLRGRELTVADVFGAVEEMCTTREALKKTLARLAHQGRIVRVRRGVYRAGDEDDHEATVCTWPVGSVDNSLAESTIGLCKADCIHHEGPWGGVDDAELTTLNRVCGGSTRPVSTRPSDTSTRRVRDRLLPSRSTPTSRRWRENPPATEPGRFTRFGAARRERRPTGSVDLRWLQSSARKAKNASSTSRSSMILTTALSHLPPRVASDACAARTACRGPRRRGSRPVRFAEGAGTSARRPGRWRPSARSTAAPILHLRAHVAQLPESQSPLRWRHSSECPPLARGRRSPPTASAILEPAGQAARPLQSAVVRLPARGTERCPEPRADSMTHARSRSGRRRLAM